MKKNNLIRFAFGLVLLPMTAVTPTGLTPKVDVPQSVLVQKLNTTALVSLALNEPIDPTALLIKAQGDAIDAYYKKNDMPLYGLGQVMAQAAHDEDIDWRLIPGISVIESTGGIHSCVKVTNSFLGYGSCHINFESREKAIQIVAESLGGNNPKTAHYYDGKTTRQILRTYNSVIKTYPEKVLKVMDQIGPEDITTLDTTNLNGQAKTMINKDPVV
ncbi:MAG: hypothetical protein NTZ44_00135 [Candidatus Nomurabacteria bacterium]|nr:hypothetical protein [Candidatus Nomurabacteria bacterium]